MCCCFRHNLSYTIFFHTQYFGSLLTYEASPGLTKALVRALLVQRCMLHCLLTVPVLNFIKQLFRGGLAVVCRGRARPEDGQEAEEGVSEEALDAVRYAELGDGDRPGSGGAHAGSDGLAGTSTSHTRAIGAGGAWPASLGFLRVPCGSC